MIDPGQPESGLRADNLPEPTGAFIWKQVPWGLALECAALAPVASHLFTTRDLAPGAGVEPDPGWARVAAHLGLPTTALVRMKQVHGCQALSVSGAAAPEPTVLPSADAAVTDSRSVALVVKTADCVPILLADRRGGGVAAIHAGWRGTAQSIAIAAVQRMALTCDSLASDIVVAIGPSIGACCYQVGPEVRDGFDAPGDRPIDAGTLARWFSPGDGDRLQLDLWRANRDQLVAAGVPDSSIHVAGLCTACHPDRFYSYRREGARAGRMLAAIRKR